MEAVVDEAEPLDALRLELGHQALADRTVRDAVERGLVGEDVRQVEDLELLDAERSELRERRREHLHRAQLQRLELLLVLVQRRVRVDLDLHLALGAVVDQLLELLGHLALRRI